MRRKRGAMASSRRSRRAKLAKSNAWFAKAGVTAWREMDVDKISKVIGWLKEKLVAASQPAEQQSVAGETAENVKPIRRRAKPQL